METKLNRSHLQWTDRDFGPEREPIYLMATRPRNAISSRPPALLSPNSTDRFAAAVSAAAAAAAAAAQKGEICQSGVPNERTNE